MPNKKRISKLKTKLLLSGKLNATAGVQQAMRYIAEKTELDKEDIDFDFEKSALKAGLGQLEAHDDDSKSKNKLKKDPHKKNKRKSDNAPPSLIDEKIKRQKMLPDQSDFILSAPNKNSNKKSEATSVLSKKSKKNKYFFMAHPEVLNKKDEILSDEKLKDKFVIDDEKLKLNEIKKKKNMLKKLKEKELEEKKDKQVKSGKKQKKNDLWVLEECNSEPEQELEEAEPKKTAKKKKNKASEELILDLDDIGRNFKLKKNIERLPDGTCVEVFKPQYISSSKQNQEEEESEEEDQELVQFEKLGESDDQHEEAEDNAEPEQEKTSENNIKSDKNVKKNYLKEKMAASRFRYLNELLYTQPSSKSFEYFQK
jgi:hypothetical protein